jgi:F0F1-type ATP synthase membrane subunit b/b'
LTTEEKLQNFYNHSLDSANREAERVIGDHQKALDKIFEEHKATARRQAEEEVAAETEKAKRDVNKTLSADQLHSRTGSDARYPRAATTGHNILSLSGSQSVLRSSWRTPED